MNKYDVIVVGAGPAGIAFAITAGRFGLKTCLFEKENKVGGAITYSFVSPLMTFHDSNNKQVIKGIAEELVQSAVKAQISYGHVPDLTGTCSTITPMIPDLFHEIIMKKLQTAKVDVFLNAEFDIKLFEQIKNNSSIIIDATGDANIINLAGGKSIFGRLPDNKTQPATLIFKMQYVDFDQIWQAIKQKPTNFALNPEYFVHPEKFQYLAVAGFFEEIKKAQAKGKILFRDRVLCFEVPFSQNQVLVNMTRILNVNGLDQHSCKEATKIALQQVQECSEVLREFIPGFQNAEVLAIAPKLGIRETRHIKGEYTLTSADLILAKHFPDTICKGAFPLDLHSPDSDETKIKKISKAYEIPFRALKPQGLTNIYVVGRCISAEHLASAGLRTIPTCMAMGEGLANKLFLGCSAP